MRSIILVLILIFNTMMSSFCQSNRNNREKGLLWEISGNGLTEKSYLFGTWHGSAGVCIDFLDSIPNFYKVFDSVSQYAGENIGDENMDGKNILEVLKEPLGEIWMPQDIKYYDLLNKTDIQFLDSLLLKYLGGTSSDVNVRPNHLFFILSAILADRPYFEAENEKCKMKMDNYLLLKAKEKNDSLVSLDSPETTKRLLMELFLEDHKPGVTLKENADYLIRKVKEFLSQDENADLQLMSENMENAYRDMDLKNLANFKKETIEIVKELLPSDYNFDENYHFSLIGRNKLWMEKIPALINEKSTFIAVGALHLCGDEGLINLLREKGYSVRSVK